MRPHRLAAATALSLVLLSTTAPPGTAAATSPPPAESVEFEMLGLVSEASRINLGPGQILRVPTDVDVDSTADLLSVDADESFAAGVVATIGDVPDGRTVLVGVVGVSCTPPKEVGLERLADGQLVMQPVGPEPEPVECDVAIVTVAVLSVAAEDAPFGSTDHAELVTFEHAGYEPPEAWAVELTSDPGALERILPADAPAVPSLDPLTDGRRRFALLGSGCAADTAELVVTPHVLDARFGRDDGVVVNCVRAEYSLAVFDIDEELVPAKAQLAVGPR